jgi:hypothetical protein
MEFYIFPPSGAADRLPHQPAATSLCILLKPCGSRPAVGNPGRPAGERAQVLSQTLGALSCLQHRVPPLARKK